MTALLQLACLLSEIGACVLYWRWRIADGRAMMLVAAVLLAMTSIGATAWLAGLGETRFLVAMLGFYVLAGFVWATMAGRGPSRWSVAERGVLVFGLLVATLGCLP